MTNAATDRLFTERTVIGNDLTSSPEARAYYNRKAASAVKAAPVPRRSLVLDFAKIAEANAQADAIREELS